MENGAGGRRGGVFVLLLLLRSPKSRILARDRGPANEKRSP
jgi:hypothetical protein